MRRNSRLLVGVITFIGYLPFARLDPDPHHDGIQIASAIGVSEGLKVHSQVFNQYGPITNWAQSLWMLVTPNTLLSLRIWGCLIIAISAGLITKICIQLKLSVVISVLVSLAWAASCPVWTFDPGFFGLWPWPSLLYLALSLLGISYILSWSLEDLSNYKFGFLSGVFLGLAALTRINYGVPLLLGASVAILLLVKSRSHIHWRDMSSFVIGASFIISCVVLVLWFTNSLSSFVDQAILEPLKGKSAVSTGWIFFRDLYLVTSYKYLIIFCMSFVFLRYAKSMKVRMLIFVASVFLISMELSAISYADLIALNFTKAWLVNRNSDLLQLSLIATIFALIGGPILLGRSILASLFRLKNKFDFELFILVVGSLAALLQLYPLSDVYHLWWTSPLLLILFFRFFSLNTSSSLISFVTLLIFVVSGISSSRSSLQIPRMYWSSGVLDGMLIPANNFEGFVSADRALAQNDLKSRYLCRDGLWAVWRGRYQSSSPNFVEWGFATEDRSVDESIVVCDWPGDGLAADQLDRPIISTGGTNAFDYSRFSGGYFLEVLGSSSTK